jgi:hypothetical protein
MIHYQIPLKTDTGQLLPCFSKILEDIASAVRFNASKSVSSFDFSQELLVGHSRNEWRGSVDCVISKRA